MKRLLAIIVILELIFIPFNVSAKSHKINFTCDSKQEMNDGTFYMTCHLLVTSDYEINHIEGTLTLKNVTLESIKTSGDWVNNNGVSINTDFTSETGSSGSFSVADFLFTGDLNADECSALFTPVTVEKVNDNHVCAIVDDIYYGKDGVKVSKETYYEECCDYICTVVDDEYYFNSKGESVTYEEMLSDCNTVDNSPTGVDYRYLFMVPVGLGLMLGMLKFVKKNTKIYKI